MVRFTPTDERLHSKVKDCLQSLSKLLSPTTELYVASEVNVQRLLASLDDPYPCARVGLIGHKLSGKSSIINAVGTSQILPEDTLRMLAVSPKAMREEDIGVAREMDPLLAKRSTGKAIAKGVDNCREHLISEEHTFFEELADRKLTMPILPKMTPTEMYCTTVEFIDCPAEACAFAPQLCQASSDVRHPNVYNADAFWNCIDTRVLARLINVLVPEYSTDAVGIEDEEQRAAALEAVQSAGKSSVTVDLAKRAARDLLYHVYSRCNADVSTPATSKAYAASITTFILTHIDEVIAGRDRVYEAEIRKLLLGGFVELISIASEGTVKLTDPEKQVVFFSAPSVSCTLRLLAQSRPSIQEIYDYCEDNMGLGFMQTIDDIEEEQLRRVVSRYAQDEIYKSSGAEAIVERMKLVDFNSGKLWIRGVCLGGIECLDQLAIAGETSKPALARQLAEAQVQLTELLKELEWAVSAAQRIKNYCMKTMIATQVQFANRELDNFLQQCLEDVRYVLEHRELEWYRERHACTVVEMNSALKKLEAFTDSYMIKRAFLERKIQIRDKPDDSVLFPRGGGRGGGCDDDATSIHSSKFSAHQGSVAPTMKTNLKDPQTDLDAMVERRIQQIRQTVVDMGTVEPTVVVGTNPFLEDNAEQFLDALEAEKQRHLVDFFVRVCHHIRDRYEELIPDLMKRLDEQKQLALQKLKDLISEPVHEAFERLGIPFDIESAMAQLYDVDLIQGNRRRLNSFLRELPEHVAAAAIEISNQWYQPAQSVEVKGLKTTIPLTVSPIPTAFLNTTAVEGSPTQTYAAGSAINAISGGAAANGRRRSSVTVKPGNQTLSNASMAGLMIDPLKVPPTIGEWARTSSTRQAIFPSHPSQLPFDANCEPHHKIHPQLLYVYESWRLTFEAIELHQMSQFNVHDLSVAATNTNNLVVEYINGYVETLEEGVIAQKASIQELQEAQQTMATAVANGKELLGEFKKALVGLNEAIEDDLSVAEKVVAEERAQWGM